MNIQNLEGYKKSKLKIKNNIYYRIELVDIKNSTLNNSLCSNEITIKGYCRLKKMLQKMTKKQNRRTVQLTKTVLLQKSKKFKNKTV